jgi:hypothetical protein
MRTDPHAPQILIDYRIYCETRGYVDFELFVTHWRVVTAFIEAAEEEGLSLEEMRELADVVFPAKVD